MKRFAIAAAVVLVACCAGLGAPPEVPAAEVKIKPGQMFRLPVTKVTGDLGMSKNFTDLDAFFGEMVAGPKGEKHFVFQAPQLEYDDKGALKPPSKTHFVLSFWNKGDTTGVTTTLVLDYQKVKPQPNPNPQSGPQPAPPDPPAPAPPGKRFILIIEETGDAVAARGILFADPALAARTKEQGHKWRVVDKDNKTASGQTPPDLEPYLKEAVGKKLPRLYIVSPDGIVCYQGDAPNDPATVAAKMLDIIKKAGG